MVGNLIPNFREVNSQTQTYNTSLGVDDNYHCTKFWHLLLLIMKWAINHIVFNQRTNCFSMIILSSSTSTWKGKNSNTKLISLFFFFLALFSSFESVNLTVFYHRFPYTAHIIHTVAFSYELYRHRSNKEFEVKIVMRKEYSSSISTANPPTPPNTHNRKTLYKPMNNTVTNILQCTYLCVCVYIYIYIFFFNM